MKDTPCVHWFGEAARQVWFRNYGPIWGEIFHTCGDRTCLNIFHMSDKTIDNETQWDAMRRNRLYFPEKLKGNRDSVAAELEQILKARGIDGHVEVETDQIDVYSKRCIATYMVT